MKSVHIATVEMNGRYFISFGGDSRPVGLVNWP